MRGTHDVTPNGANEEGLRSHPDPWFPGGTDEDRQRPVGGSPMLNAEGRAGLYKETKVCEA